MTKAMNRLNMNELAQVNGGDFLGRIADGCVTITLGFMVFLAKQEGKTWEQFCDQIDAKNRSSEMLELLKGMWFSSDK